MPDVSSRFDGLGVGFAPYLQPPGPDVVRLTVGEPGFETPRQIIDEAIRGLENGDTKYMGKVSYDTDTYNQSLEEAKENGDIFIDTYAEEVDEKAESDVDIALNLENESKIGK